MKEIQSELDCLSSPSEIKKMKRIGISFKQAKGVSLTSLRSIAKKYYPNHQLAQELWDCSMHETKILAIMIDIPKEVTLAQITKWSSQFYSWDICDLSCRILFEKTKYVSTLINRWSKCKKVFLKRASFVLIARQAKMNKKLSNKRFLRYLDILLLNSTDDRNLVMKGNAWALRQIGKRNDELKSSALLIANAMKKKGDYSSNWIAQNFYFELKIVKDDRV